MWPAKQSSLWNLALSSLQREIPALLLYVVQSKGSSPGRPGFFMVINAAGEKEGSIGGGIMEHKFIEWAKDQLRKNIPLIQLRRQVHDKAIAKDQSGMICSGEQTILAYTLRPDDRASIEQLLAQSAGRLQFSPQGLSFSAHPPQTPHHFHYSSETDWEYTERTGFKNRLFIIGGGHVALAFSRLMQTLDFYTMLFDDRSGLDTFEKNDFVQEKKLVGDYSELKAMIKTEKQDFIVVMTQGYRTDDQAIRALIDGNFKYFGVLGSKAKIEKLFAAYRAEGVSEEAIQKLRAPAGLAIHSQTPEEIAVSIAAEIIQHLHTPPLIS